MNLTLAITTFNRYEMLLESFTPVLTNPRIDEILIMDDHSEDKYWNKIKDLAKFNPKIKVCRQAANRGMSVNKRDAVFNSKNDWVILFDSDNICGPDYVNNIPVHLKPNTIYCPWFAKPNFDYRVFKDDTVSKNTLKHLNRIDHTALNCLLNTCNYVVHRESYLKTWEENKSVKASDTIWFNYLWLKSNGVMYVVAGMEYEHRVHNGSGFLENVDYNMLKAEETKKLIMSL